MWQIRIIPTIESWYFFDVLNSHKYHSHYQSTTIRCLSILSTDRHLVTSKIYHMFVALWGVTRLRYYEVTLLFFKKLSFGDSVYCQITISVALWSDNKTPHKSLKMTWMIMIKQWGRSYQISRKYFYIFTFFFLFCIR